MISGIARQVDSWIFDDYVARRFDLSVYRIIYATYVLLVVLPIGRWLTRVPAAFFSPRFGLSSVSTSFPPSDLVVGTNLALGLFATLLLIGWRTPIVSLVVAILMLILDSWVYSIGKIDHDFLLVATPSIMAFSGWGSCLSLDSKASPRGAGLLRRQGSWCLSLLAFVIGITMFTAGWEKLTTGWLDPTTSSTYGHLSYNYFATGRQTWLTDRLISTNARWLWEPGDWLATFLELSLLFASFRRRVMLVALALTCLFHFGIMLLFDIVFASNIIAYAAFFPYSALPVGRRVIEAALSRGQGRRPWLIMGLVVAALLITSTMVWRGGSLASYLKLRVDVFIVWTGASFGAAYLVSLVLTAMRSHGRRQALSRSQGYSGSLPLDVT